MTHGIAAFFAERARFERRLSTITLGVGLAAVAAFWCGRAPMVQRAIDPVRFGFEGPDQYVRRILLQQYRGTGRLLSDVGPIESANARPGGGTRTRSRTGTRPALAGQIVGPGIADEQRFLRDASRFADVPVVQEEDLVIEHRVVPQYPAEMFDQDIEGRVLLQAHVDTAGRVINVDVFSSSSQDAFARSAAAAVWQWRFRPYRKAGIAREVAVPLTFNFTIGRVER